jgi:CRP/FNR family transcriptional regulator
MSDDKSHLLNKLLESMNDQAGRDIIKRAKFITLPEKTTVFYQGDACHHYLLVQKGAVKVFTRAENGREITLYRVVENESCVLTTSCMLAANKYPAEGITETKVEAIAIATEGFNYGLAQSASFRTLVFNHYSQRLSDVISLVAEISFARLDIRLAKYLTQQNKTSLTITHQTLAIELGTAREVISRQLKTFEQNNYLTLSRGHIEQIDLTALEAIAKTILD